MVMNAKDIAKAIEAGPPGSSVRNINYDTHIGAAPQRPFAVLEDQMARVTLGHNNVDDLKRMLNAIPRPEGLPEGAPNPNEVHEVNGALVRYVPSQKPREAVMIDGIPHDRITYEMRHVAATQAGARAASEAGTPTDFFNGFTWLRDGFKPERDFPVMAQAAAESNTLVFDAPMSPSSVARLHHEVSNAQRAAPPLPVEASKPAAASKPKSASKSAGKTEPAETPPDDTRGADADAAANRGASTGGD